MTDDRRDLAARRVEHAIGRLQDAWSTPDRDLRLVSHKLDELDVAIELWLNLGEEVAGLGEQGG